MAIPIPTDKPRVKLVGTDGNAFAIMGKSAAAMRAHGYSSELVDQYLDEAMSGDYDHLLATTLAYVDEASDEEEPDGIDD